MIVNEKIVDLHQVVPLEHKSLTTPFNEIVYILDTNWGRSVRLKYEGIQTGSMMFVDEDGVRYTMTHKNDAQVFKSGNKVVKFFMKL